jgi:rhomboid family GlyGly-CTERM serine protease
MKPAGDPMNYSVVILRGGGRIPYASLLLGSLAIIVHLIPGVAAALEYDRAAILGGEVWRAITGHWTHFSLDHLFWDALMFAVLGAACEMRGRARFLIATMGSAPAISLAVWMLAPDVDSYRGLSGIDSALFALLAADLAAGAIRERRRGAVILCGVLALLFIGKVSYEAITGDTLFVASGGTLFIPVPIAHLAGALVGAACGLAWHLARRIRLLPESWLWNFIDEHAD